MQEEKLKLLIDGKQIKRPTTFKLSSYRLTKSGRVADGTMTAEIVAKKRKIFLTYDVMDSKQAQQLEELVESDSKFFFTVTYTDDGEEKTMTAYAGEFTKTLVRVGNGVWYWKDVEVNLIEQ